MALDIDVLATRWGLILGGINAANTFSGTTIPARADSISDEYASFSAQRTVVDDLYNNSVEVQSALSTYTDYLKGIAETTLSRMCQDDTARPKTDDLQGWFEKLNRDMVTASDTFNRPAITATVAVPGTNIGTGYLLASVVDPIDGLQTYYSYSEVIRIDCITDSYISGSTAGSETFSVDGETETDKMATNWPKGSGTSTSISTVIPDTDDFVTDGGLEAWGGTGNNTPTSWEIYGTAGTNIFRGSGSGATAAYTGDYYCIFTGDGATYPGIYQDVALLSSTNYAVQFWVKLPSGTLGTGSPTSLRVAITDGSGTVLSDNHSVTQSSSIGASTLNGYTSWTRVGVVLRTPRSLPTGARLEIKFTTNPLDNAKSVWIDHIDIVEMQQLYNGGPYIAMIGGATGFAIGDKFTLTIANDKSTTNFVRCLDRLFDLADLNIRLQTNESPTPATIDDNLIT